MFESGKYEEAKEKYELAASIQKDNNVADGINACNDRLKKIEDLYIDLLNKATHFENRGDLTQAIDFLNQAITLKGKNEELKSRVKKLKFDLEFKSSTIPTNHNKTKPSKPNIDKLTNNRDQEEFFDLDKKKERISKSQINEVENKENFFNTKTKNGMKKNHDGFDFLKTGSHKNETKSNIDGEDDFSNNGNKKNINTTKENFDW